VEQACVEAVRGNSLPNPTRRRGKKNSFNIQITSTHMHRPLLIVLAVSLLASCENATFSKDKRQLIAKNAIRHKLPRAAKDFDIIGYKEDTLASWTDTTFKRPIRYTLHFVYSDSTGAVHQQTGSVLFTPDGRSMITAQLDNPNH
jgi:hypothetical protein